MIRKKFSADLTGRSGKTTRIDDGDISQRDGAWDADGARADVQRLYAGHHLEATNIEFRDAD
jgi:hypothetical protein